MQKPARPPILHPMKQIILSSCLAVALSIPAAGQAQEQDGFNLMEEGARLLFRGLMQEMEPALRELETLPGELEPALRGLVENFGPSLGALLEQVEDFSKYHPPEILPNGDIIIRRKTVEELAIDPPEGAVDL